MGPCMSVNDKKGLSASARKNSFGQPEKISNLNQLAINKSLFISKNMGKFKENYQIGQLLG